MEPRPPLRPPHFSDDNDGPATLASAQWLLSVLCSFASQSTLWLDRSGREITVTVTRETEHAGHITLRGAITGHIQLSIDPSLWVRADFHRDGVWFGRGWIERCYEECEIWPDGADGIVGPRVEDDPPGRISKRGYWIQFDTTQWPGYACAERYVGFEIPGD